MDLFDVWQNAQIRDVRQAASDASTDARKSATNVRYVADEIARLELITEAMWELVKEKTGLGDDDLLAKIAELDLSDGKADGKKDRSGPIVCAKCNRPNSRRHDFCIYCGQFIRTQPFQ